VPDRLWLYTDEHVPKAVVKGLRERGIDTLTVSEADTLGASDEEHLAFAY
jgi:precorrin-6B methylase 1